MTQWETQEDALSAIHAASAQRRAAREHPHQTAVIEQSWPDEPDRYPPPTEYAPPETPYGSARASATDWNPPGETTQPPAPGTQSVSAPSDPLIWVALGLAVSSFFAGPVVLAVVALVVARMAKNRMTVGSQASGAPVLRATEIIAYANIAMSAVAVVIAMIWILVMFFVVSP